MDSKENVTRSTLSSPLRSRPSFAPAGPRTLVRSLPLEPSLNSRAASRSSSIRIPSPAYSAIPSPVTSSFSEAFTQQPILPPAYTPLPESSKSSESSSSLSSSLSPPPAPPARASTPIPKITAPPQMRFESQPVQWKALPLEAAMWTLSSEELQQIVSRAIRSSARESFIRLLPLENFERILPSELERLEARKLSLQSKYRFLMHRRTMLLQALVTSAQVPSLKDKSREDTMDSIPKLALQLSETTIECDRLLEQLLLVTDQTAQINRMLDVHWASALAIALRKLNNSYGQRTADLQKARDRILQLQAELEDAWKEAENLARELDEYEEGMVSDAEDEGVIETAEVVSVPLTPASPVSPTTTTTPTLLNLDPSGPRVPAAPLSPRTAMPTADIPADVNAQDDNMSIRSRKSTRSMQSMKSTKSGRSHRSARGDSNSRAQLVSAARKRSYRASQNELRLNHHSRKPSTSRTKGLGEEQPPVPDLPLQFSTPVMPTHSAKASSTLLHWEIPPDPSSAITADESTGSTRVPANLDDIRLNDSNNIIEEVPRNSKRKNLVLDDIGLSRSSRPSPSPTSNIPSIWKNADAPKTPAERVESLMQRNANKSTPYQKLRTLTKRYSVPFPLFPSARSTATRRSYD